MGCFADGAERDLSFAIWQSILPKNTVENCALLCVSNGYKYAGLQFAYDHSIHLFSLFNLYFDKLNKCINFVFKESMLLR